jgi:hypothetical protein
MDETYHHLAFFCLHAVPARRRVREQRRVQVAHVRVGVDVEYRRRDQHGLPRRRRPRGQRARPAAPRTQASHSKQSTFYLILVFLVVYST